MERRTYLSSLGTAGLLATAGCLETIQGSADGDREQPEQGHSSGETEAQSTPWEVDESSVVLEPPADRRGRPSHQIYGDEFPSFTLPDPLTGESISGEQFEGDRSILMTFFFASCPDGACPALIQRLVQAQLDAEDRGYEDDVAFLAMTFDPEQDTAEELEDYADDFGIDLEAGNWHFLRPESYEAGKELLDDEFGMPIERVELEEGEDVGEGGDDGHADDHGDEDGHDHADHDHEYDFIHYNLILLVNEDGIVERSYPQATQIGTETILEDLQTVVEGTPGGEGEKESDE
ncbi:SCO family protein [Halobacteria archaeon AArc-m2/3/4]|uniref:SCO family protein n=1 Tax=Natronoglomus mannanivorans TaxID=2979990 RepID=A0AAP2Z068_9EURY|nr:SCO family protein [Halobacteria archaeon AArc-xg1-1]MCU4974235.1 SCO family protein [Halobacteria archaeon AArc-m2/3/4]